MNKIDALVNDVSKNTATAVVAIEAKLAQLEDGLQAVAKESKKRLKITMVLIILTLATTFAAFIRTLFPDIGG